MAENFDQTRQRSPFTSVDGSETIVLNQGGVTKGGFLSVIKDWILDTLTVTRSQIDDATGFGRDLLAVEDATELTSLVEFPAVATATELEEGTVQSLRMVTPQLVVGAINFHAGKVPFAIDANTIIDEDDLSSILVCDAIAAISITVPVMVGVQHGSLQVINLAPDPVSILTDSTILIDSTGTIVNKDIAQYEHVELIYLGDDTWYIRET